MRHVLDLGLVALAVAVSLGYAAFALGPKSFRRGIAQRLLGIAARSAQVPLLNRFTRRLSAAAAAKLQGGSCGGCDSCGSETAASGVAASGAAGEVRIPVAQIRRRAG